MATITSARDKNFLGGIAHDIGCHAEASVLMTAPGAVEVPASLERKLLDVQKRKGTEKVSLAQATDALAIIRRAS